MKRHHLLGLVVAAALAGSGGPALALTLDERVQILWDRADQQVVLEKWDDLYATARRAAQIAPDSADAWALRAYVAWLPSRYETAEAACRRALELDPGCFRAHYVRGLILTDQRRPAAATAAFREALRLNPGYARAHAGLGTVLCGVGQAAEAIAELEEANRLQPGHWAWVQSLAWALGAGGRVADGLEVNAEAFDLSRTDLEKVIVHNDAAYLYACKGEKEAALREARAALDLLPDDPDLLDTLGALTALFGDPQAAEAPLRRAMEFPSHWSASHTALAYSLASQGRTAEAREELAQVSKELVEEGVSLDALYFAGLAYDKLGEATIAKRIFTRATQGWPSHPWSEQMRTYLAEHQDQ